MRKLAVVTNIKYNGQSVSQLCSDVNELLIKSQAVLSAKDASEIGDLVSMSLNTDSTLRLGIVTDLVNNNSDDKEEEEFNPGGKEEVDPCDKEEEEFNPGGKDPFITGTILIIRSTYDGEDIEMSIYEWESNGMLFPHNTIAVYTGNNLQIVVAVANSYDTMYLILNDGWYCLSDLHDKAVSLENPIQTQLWSISLSDWTPALKVEYSENNKDEFYDDMYAIPSANIGYHPLSDLQELGYLLEEPANCNVYIAGNTEYTQALRHPNNDDWETVSY